MCISANPVWFVYTPNCTGLYFNSHPIQNILTGLICQCAGTPFAIVLAFAYSLFTNLVNGFQLHWLCLLALLLKSTSVLSLVNSPFLNRALTQIITAGPTHAPLLEPFYAD
ncbi:hypothetical protein TOT_020000488 [Theileria orientalis strain Shintoku]|uniref:Uncharacterized protein n=1 Tax=Theileria orientalis strain Shintoku TaxID=869250 RepID=J4CCZ0_THEOR|nr:hypothetical protein TOT_020000488 [Theileria orientalis strain Shintoku]PVC51546.1 hypothetical protein MACL_00001459 [Theileria orientalis]BAM40227.1 hypothetical protein TOT_020000488 [Theileria orientalis strain Shintoku]|eukprot:XP_009690528.1 hypothetical protein TOT_020000488 [Theileria orientalis strain Shintoku]